MSRRAVYTATGIILSFAIAIGGWVATSRLIDMESDRLLSASASFSVDMPVAAEPLSADEDDDNPYITFGLTDNEIVSVLRNWELTHYRRPHEPAPGQIDMTTAIISGRAGINFLEEQNILPPGGMDFDHTGAFLSQNVPRGEDFLPLIYSYWTVFFSNENVSVNMTINAVTGQIWEIELVVRSWRIPGSIMPFSLSANRDDITNALSVFMSNLDIQPVDGTMHGLLYPFDFEFDERGNALVPLEGRDPDAPLVLFPPPGRNIDTEIADLFRWLWYFENGLMVGHSIAEGNARAEVLADGSIPGGVLHFNRLHIRLTVSPQPRSWLVNAN